MYSVRIPGLDYGLVHSKLIAIILMRALNYGLGRHIFTFSL